MFGEKLILSCLMGKIWAGYLREVSWKVSRHLESLWFNCRLVTQYGGGAVSLATGASCRPPPPRPSRAPDHEASKERRRNVCLCVSHASAFPSILWPRRASTNNREENPTGHDDNLSTKGRDVHCCPSRQQDRENRRHAWGSHVLCLFNSASPHLGDWIQSFHNGHVTCAKKKYGLKKLGT